MESSDCNYLSIDYDPIYNEQPNLMVADEEIIYKDSPVIETNTGKGILEESFNFLNETIQNQNLKGLMIFAFLLNPVIRIMLAIYDFRKAIDFHISIKDKLFYSKILIGLLLLFNILISVYVSNFNHRVYLFFANNIYLLLMVLYVFTHEIKNELSKLSWDTILKNLK